MRLRLCPALLVFSVFFLFPAFTLAGPVEDCAEYAKLGVPGQEGETLCRTGHLLAHHPEYKTPIWVIERLTKEKADSKVVPRYNKFQEAVKAHQEYVLTSIVRPIYATMEQTTW